MFPHHLLQMFHMQGLMTLVTHLPQVGGMQVTINMHGKALNLVNNPGKAIHLEQRMTMS